MHVLQNILLEKLKASSRESAPRAKMRSPAPTQKVPSVSRSTRENSGNFSQVKVAEGFFMGSFGCLKRKAVQ